MNNGVTALVVALSTLTSNVFCVPAWMVVVAGITATVTADGALTVITASANAAVFAVLVARAWKVPAVCGAV